MSDVPPEAVPIAQSIFILINFHETRVFLSCAFQHALVTVCQSVQWSIRKYNNTQAGKYLDRLFMVAWIDALINAPRLGSLKLGRVDINAKYLQSGAADRYTSRTQSPGTADASTRFQSDHNVVCTCTDQQPHNQQLAKHGST